MNVYIEQWLWWRSVPVRGNPVREHVGRSLSGNSEGKIDISRGVQMPFKRVSIERGPVGEHGGDSLDGTFSEKRIVYLGSFL